MSFWQDRNVFVTGATGLLGGWLVEELIRRDANVVCLVRDIVPNARFSLSPAPSKATLVHGDLTDFETVLRALNEHEINTVFHVAAQAIVGTAGRSALSTFESNIRGSWTILEACRQLDGLVERVVVASSDKAYGEHEQLPYKEDAPLAGRFPYDVSKACTDLISFSYFHSYGVPVAITRCGNLYGGGDLNWNRIVPGTIRSVLRDEQPIIRSDGQFVRDYFYVRDAVGAYITLAEQLPGQRTSGEAFNFGPDTPLTVVEVVDAILKQMGREDLQPQILNQASREIRKQYLDCTKAREVLGWTSKFTFSQGLAETVEWYKNYLQEPHSPAAP